MKAVRYHEYGDESVLRHEETERPTPGPGQVLLQVAGTAFNPVDVAIRAGYLSQGLPLSFPHVPGFDVAGTVVELGDGVQEPHLGDEVIAFLPMDRDGAAAEYVVTAADLLVTAPLRLALSDAAALPSAALTAYQALHEHVQIRSGQRLLVNGAGGSVGGLAVQLAKEAGASVTAVVGPADADRVRRYGADRLVDRTREQPTDAVDVPVDAVLDLAPVGPAAAAVLMAGIRPGGVYVTTVPGPVEPVGDVRVVTVFVRPDTAQLAALVGRVDAGRLQVHVAETLPLGELASVHARSAAGRLHGKVVLVP
jgi:NADPH:quinone reductase-like Zn-dependent oxidoreductase